MRVASAAGEAAAARVPPRAGQGPGARRARFGQGVDRAAADEYHLLNSATCGAAHRQPRRIRDMID